MYKQKQQFTDVLHFLKIFQINGKTPQSQSLFLNTVSSPQPTNLFKEGRQYRHFSFGFAKFLRTFILYNICRWLLLLKSD